MTTTEIDDFDELVARLTALGDHLDLDDTAVVPSVLERITRPRSEARPSARRWLIAAAIVALAVGVAVTPASREAVARWLGLEGVVIEVDPSLTVAPLPPSVPAPPPRFEAPGPGESRVVTVDGRQILVSAIDGRLDERLITKVVGSSDQVEAIDVMGNPGLWISGAAHEVLYESPDGEVVVERMAANTLLWHDGQVLNRVEGFVELADAIAFVEGT